MVGGGTRARARGRVGAFIAERASKGAQRLRLEANEGMHGGNRTAVGARMWPAGGAGRARRGAQRGRRVVNSQALRPLSRVACDQARWKTSGRAAIVGDPNAKAAGRHAAGALKVHLGP
jgi:hypothetical protein